METDELVVALVSCFMIGFVIYFARRKEKTRNNFLIDCEDKFRCEGYDWFFYGLEIGERISVLALDIRRGVVSFVELGSAYDSRPIPIKTEWTVPLTKIWRLETFPESGGDMQQYRLEVWPERGHGSCARLCRPADEYRSFASFNDHVRILVEAWQEKRRHVKADVADE